MTDALFEVDVPTAWDTSSLSRPRLRRLGATMGPAGAEAVALYNASSGRPLHDWDGAVLPAELWDYLDLVHGAMEAPLLAERSPEPTEPWFDLRGVPEGDRRRLVLFSGGKDGVATALTLEAAGFTPILYHVAGINRGNPEEQSWARRIAQHRGWALMVDTVSVAGAKHGVIEMPTKNQVIQLLALGRMIELGLPGEYLSGWYLSDTQDVCRVDYDFSDGDVAIATFDRYMGARVPGAHHSYSGVRNDLDAFAIVARAGLLNYVKGCVLQPRFFRRVRESNERKYGPLLPGRCGACPKCAWEQVALERLGVIEENPERRQAQAHIALRDWRGRYGDTIEEIYDHLVDPAQAATLAAEQPSWPEQDEWTPVEEHHDD